MYGSVVAAKGWRGPFSGPCGRRGPVAARPPAPRLSNLRPPPPCGSWSSRRLRTTMAVMDPAAVCSLVCRSVANVTAMHRTNGHNLPLLLLFRVVVGQRNLALAHTEAHTRARMAYIMDKYHWVQLDDAAQHLEAAFHVPPGSLDVAEKVAVRHRFLSCVIDEALCGCG